MQRNGSGLADARQKTERFHHYLIPWQCAQVDSDFIYTVRLAFRIHSS